MTAEGDVTGGGPPRPVVRRGPLAVLAVLLALGGGLAAPAVAAGQQEGGDPAASAEGDEGLLVPAPRPFRLSATGSALLWEEAATRSPDDGPLWGAEIERLLIRYAFARIGASFGPSTVVSGDRSVDVNTFVVELLAGPRFALPALRRAGVVPYAGVGIGSVVHQPTEGDLATRNQNAFLWGGGVEWSFHPRWGVRGEWRRYSADLENIFAELDRTGETRDADRFQISVFWAF